MQVRKPFSCSACSTPLPPHFFCQAVHQPPVHSPGSSIVSATLGPRNPDSATKSLPLPHSCMLELLQRQLCLPPADPSSLRQNRSRLMVSHSRVQPLLFMCEAQQKRKRQCWDLVCPRESLALSISIQSGERYPGASSYRQREILAEPGSISPHQRC